MSYTFIVDHIPTNTPNNRRPQNYMSAQYITVHNTGNPNSTAKNERAWITNPSNNRTASYHYAIDEWNVVECIPVNENAWHAGDGNGSGNMKSIGVEICESGNYEKNVENAVTFIAKLLKERGWGVDRLRRHYDWSGKICPRLMYDNGSWSTWYQFLNKVENKLNGTNLSPEKGSDTDKELDNGKYTIKRGDTLWGISQAFDVSVSTLEKLNPNVNPKNLKIGSKIVVKEDKKPSTQKPSKPANKPKSKPKYKDINTNSVVDWLNANKMSSSFNSRKSLANKYGIKNYSGTVSQNTALLRKLREDLLNVKTTAKPSVTTSHKKDYVNLPASAKTWKTYRLNVTPVSKNSDWSLTPSRYGGLTYQILGKPYPNVVTIQTSKGKRNIYVAPSTGAKIYKK